MKSQGSSEVHWLAISNTHGLLGLVHGSTFSLQYLKKYRKQLKSAEQRQTLQVEPDFQVHPPTGGGSLIQQLRFSGDDKDIWVSTLDGWILVYSIAQVLEQKVIQILFALEMSSLEHMGTELRTRMS